jgi:hypothetical protein
MAVDGVHPPIHQSVIEARHRARAPFDEEASLNRPSENGHIDWGYVADHPSDDD